MTKWIVSTPLKGTDLMKNFVCFTEVELQKLLEQYPEATVEMKDSHLEDHAPLPLTGDQQVVLEWLKADSIETSKYVGNSPVLSIWLLSDLISKNFMVDKVSNAYDSLNIKQEAQVIQAFTEWWLSENE